jgi:hypothetical protein
MKRINLNKLLKYWQPIMGLSDFRIYPEYKEQPELGLTHSQYRYKRAFISMMDPKVYDEDKMGPYDIEEVFVHELGHVLMSGFPAKHEVMEDQVVETYARALLAIKRGTRAYNGEIK